MAANLLDEAPVPGARGRCRAAARKLSVAAPACLVPEAAGAHVKWFADVDPSEALRPLGEVLTEPFFVQMLMLSLAAIYVFYLFDRLALRRRLYAGIDNRLKRFDAESSLVMRVAGAIFFLSLALWNWTTHQGFLLTPELRFDSSWLPWLHLLMAAGALSRRSTPLTGLLVFVLYALTVRRYGWYHLIDYMIFLGIGYFFLVADSRHGGWRKSGFVVLYASVGLTLTWAAIEKFAYPQWTFPLLEAKPGMLMGMEPMSYMVLAGFVEFNIAFVLLSAASTLARLVAFGLQAVFVLAIFEFGLIDAIGHLMIIAILFVLYFRGPTEARNMLVLNDKSVWTEAYFMTGLYALGLLLMFLAYYGLHRVYYG